MYNYLLKSNGLMRVVSDREYKKGYRQMSDIDFDNQCFVSSELDFDWLVDGNNEILTIFNSDNRDIENSVEYVETIDVIGHIQSLIECGDFNTEEYAHGAQQEAQDFVDVLTSTYEEIRS